MLPGDRKLPTSLKWRWYVQNASPVLSNKQFTALGRWRKESKALETTFIGGRVSIEIKVHKKHALVF